jgi:hypothetical protein
MSTNYIMTRGGQRFDFRNPHAFNYQIEDIAHSLSQICRFTGHTTRHYSVAQHSVMVSHLVPPEDAMCGLLHDAAEAFLGDVASPLKALLPDYRSLEADVEGAVMVAFGLGAMPASVKHADLIALSSEAAVLMAPEWDRFGLPEPLRDVRTRLLISPQTPLEARAAFMARYRELLSV